MKKKNIFRRIADYFAVLSFVNKVRKECRPYEGNGAMQYIQEVLKSIVANSDALPNCLKEKEQFEYMVQILTSIVDMDLVAIETEVRQFIFKSNIKK